MIEILINNKKYNGIEKWSEMSCSMAAELYKIPIPEKLKEYYTLSVENKPTEDCLISITDEQMVKEFPSYYGQVIKILYNVPDKVINKVKHQDRTWLFDTYCRTFILGLHWSPNMDKIGLKELKCGDETLIIPQSKFVLGQEVPAPDEDAETFAEAADLMLNLERFQGGRYEVATNLISIFCRPKGEVYNESRCLKRAELLKDVKMDVVWEVFFCLTEFITLRNLHDLQSLIKQAESKKKWLRRLLDYLKWDGTVRFWIWQKNIKAWNTLKG